MSNQILYLMDSEFCSECGCILLYFECDLCDDCRDKLNAREEQWGNIYDLPDEDEELAFLAEYYATIDRPQ